MTFDSRYSIKPFNKESIKNAVMSSKWETIGRVKKVVGNVIEANIPGVCLGTIVNIYSQVNEPPLIAEVVGFKEANTTLLYPYSSLSGVAPGQSVKRVTYLDKISVGSFLLGKVIDPFLNPMGDHKLDIPLDVEVMNIERHAPDPMKRERIERPLCLGIKALDSLLTFGEGQRIGVMAGSGVGKSVLMGMIARNSDADVNVIGLIGERGREVKEFLERDLGQEGLKKSVVCVVTGEKSALTRLRCAYVVTTIAEYFSSIGKKVMLMMDSLTRVAMAQREIGLEIGEPPTTRGYTPSVFSVLPKILERAGPQITGHGSISAIYTVLVEGDDFNDPVSDAARSILDGQINLSRELAARGHYPAIDIPSSISRTMRDIVDTEHWNLALRLKELIAIYQNEYDMVQLGQYVKGTNKLLDFAIDRWDMINAFLKQGLEESFTLEQSLNYLKAILNE